MMGALVPSVVAGHPALQSLHKTYSKPCQSPCDLSGQWARMVPATQGSTTTCCCSVGEICHQSTFCAQLVAFDGQREMTVLGEAGYKEVTLLGQNVDAYGRDLPGEASDGSGRRARTFTDLLRYVHEAPGIQRIRFATSHPRCAGSIAARVPPSNLIGPCLKHLVWSFARQCAARLAGNGFYCAHPVVGGIPCAPCA